MKKLAVLPIAFLALAITAAPAMATLKLTLSSGADTVIQSSPGGIPNIFVGAVGGWSINVTTGLNLGGALIPNIDLNSVDVSVAGNSPLTITLESDGLGGVGYSHPGLFSFGIGGTTEGIVSSATAFLDDSVGAPQTLGVLGPFGPPAGIAQLAFSDQVTVGPSTEGPPYAVGIEVVLDHLGGAGVTSFNAQLKAVPEPSAFLYGGVVAGIAGLGYRGRRWYAGSEVREEVEK